MVWGMLVSDLVSHLGIRHELNEAMGEALGPRSWFHLSCESFMPTQRAYVGELFRTSTATSKMAPLNTRTSLACARGAF